MDYHHKIQTKPANVPKAKSKNLLVSSLQSKELTPIKYYQIPPITTQQKTRLILIIKTFIIIINNIVHGNVRNKH